LKPIATIQKVIACFLLVVFAISAAPKAYFHDAFANHQDTYQACTDKLKDAHFHPRGINCHFDQLVVSCLFHFAGESFNHLAIRFFNSNQPHQLAVHSFQPVFSKVNRGPPAFRFLA